MKLKGKAIFELTNVETGEKRVVKEENMVTNAFSHLVQGCGIFGGQIYQNVLNTQITTSGMSGVDYNRNMLRTLTNGLLLLNDKLEEDADHIYLTADDPDVVGVGADLAYIGNQTCAGSYNKTESGPIENGYKHVWDFTTSQGNGDIGCACLTSIEGASLGGGAGLPTYSSDWRGRLDHFKSLHTTYLPKIDDYCGNLHAWQRLGYIDEGRNLFIRVKDYYSFPHAQGSTQTGNVYNELDINGNVVIKKTFDRTFIYKKSIDFNIYRLPFDNLSIFDPVYYKNAWVQTSGTSGTNYSWLDTKLLDTVTVQMPDDLAALIPDDIVQASINTSYRWPTAINTDEGFMYISFIIPRGTSTNDFQLRSGDKIYTWKINMNTFESSWFATTNTTGQTLKLYDYIGVTYHYVPFVCVSNNYTILFEEASSSYPYERMWIIDNETGSTIKQVVDSNDNVISLGSTYGWYVYNDLVILIPSYNTYNIPVINLKTGIVKYMYAQNITSFFYNSKSLTYPLYRTYGTKFPKMVVGYCYNTTSYLTFFINPTFLMTINNLEDVVTKTSAETMKVTYIITESEEE